ncbi:GNAT family N-acetyltransferase [Fibrella sp. HMF5335]|uniref:GNAT family N-acetyltransferase n=1 Tax=Fibrella rubiginis TaxID=2817060 RepID=A0A939GKZ5_9BACT|nr:GNAT family N-acetyltransferase [Fibrella rubiginis]MBO0938328.1 GNAT family N-acetyltransferase [Fibrella rubiginis]
MLPFVQTARLFIAPLTVDDSEFMRELVNTKGWLDFVGNRHVYSSEDARNFCQDIINSPTRHYSVVFNNESNLPIGIISYVKRDYLDHHDIGFAFLPAYMGLGYAYEATRAVLLQLGQQPLLATTVPDNVNSMKLLAKLGFKFDKEISRGGDKLVVFRLKKTVY